MPHFILVDHHRKDFGVFARLVGCPLQFLARDQYVFDGTPDDEDDGSLEIRFTNDGVITLGVASDGESVVANAGPLVIPEPFTASDGSRCEWQRVELTATEPWSTLCGRSLSRVEAMVEHCAWDNHTKRYVSGWILWFGSDFVGYYNFGDVGKVTFSQQAPLFDDVTTTYERVAPAHTA